MMSDIRCPMCGKENPPDLEVCQFCQARLSPVMGQPPPDDSGDAIPEAFSFQQSESQPETDLPEWLANLRSAEGESQDRSSDELSSEEQSIQDDMPSGTQEARPEWLSDLRDDAGIDTESSDSVASEEVDSSDLVHDFDFQTDDEQLPEWLESLGSPAEGEVGPLDEQEEDSDWLDRIRRRKQDDERIAYQASLDEAEDAADSFPSLPSFELEEPEVEAQPPTFDFEVPEPAVESSEPISEEGEQGLPESEFRFEDEIPSPSSETDESLLGAVVPAFDGEELLEEPSTTDPEWLRNLKEETPSGEEDEAVTRKLDELPLEPHEETDESPDALPDWLAEEVGAPETPEPESEEMPDWLAEAVPEETPPLPAEEEPGVVPDWLAEEVGAPETPVQESEETPEWIAESLPDEIPPLPAGEEEPDVAPGDIEAGEVPDWMDELSESPDALPSEEETSEFQLEKTPYLPIPEDADLSPTGEEDLAGELEQEIEGEIQPDEKEAESDLAPADLPVWLEAMRPVETAAPSVRDMDVDIVESAGPLAGLSGVLAAGPEVPGRPGDSVYSAKLQVSKEQREHVDLLEAMVAGEGKPRPIPKQSVISPQNILRWVIALVLFVAILWPAITADQQVPMPTFNPETGDVNSLINDLPEDARLLVAFDYQPGLAAEMDTAAAAVLDHIMLRGAYLTFVSTSPTGPLVAERFLSQTQSTHNYTNGEQYINMGYIPGGAAGLLSLAVSPQRTIPYTTDGVEAWEIGGHNALPPLDGIGSIADFSMVLVIVDDPDVARAWVEQVQPYLTGDGLETPLVMVVSAQSEPLMRPYYEAFPQQLQGFVAGMRGGASYARLTGRVSLPSQYWDAFSAGLTVAAVLIAIGGMVNVASILISRRDQSEGEAKS
jgi:hypothetical protein